MKSHDGHPLNELVDCVCECAARGSVSMSFTPMYLQQLIASPSVHPWLFLAFGRGQPSHLYSLSTYSFMFVDDSLDSRSRANGPRSLPPEIIAQGYDTVVAERENMHDHSTTPLLVMSFNVCSLQDGSAVKDIDPGLGFGPVGGNALPSCWVIAAFISLAYKSRACTELVWLKSLASSWFPVPPTLGGATGARYGLAPPCLS